ncbi:MAG: hypothetical protein F4X66_03520 [Chloroflexi bacterium]|nr:hypothetical protein [Chloroflexota bacterium]MYE39539.1 hypothetical protein [Chloroflexota bacterium]
MPNSEQNWGTACIGIITFATVLAAATSAGIFAVTARQENYSEWVRALAAFLVIVSLLAYAFVTVFGLATLFRETSAEQRTEAARTARSAFVQSYSAVLAAILLILFPLLERVPW